VGFGDVTLPSTRGRPLPRVPDRAPASQASDREFLEKVFHKLTAELHLWVNARHEGKNSSRALLGLDNIGVFDRSAPLPKGGRIEQSADLLDGHVLLNMLAIAPELARPDPAYETSPRNSRALRLHRARGADSATRG